MGRWDQAMCQAVLSLSKWEAIDQEITIFKCGLGGNDKDGMVRFVSETAPWYSGEAGLEES